MPHLTEELASPPPAVKRPTVAGLEDANISAQTVQVYRSREVPDP